MARRTEAGATGERRTASRGDSWATSPAVRTSMRANRSHDTAPEKRLRSALHRRSLRYRVQYKPLPGLRRTVDVAFTRARVAVEVRGCFWHVCPLHGTHPKTNAEYWNPKLARNVERDAETADALTRAGWVLVAVWEHEDPEQAAEEIRRIVLSRQPQARRSRLS